MLAPFSADDDVSVLVQDAYRTTSAPELRTKIKLMNDGRAVITAPGWIEPMICVAGQEIVIDLSVASLVDAIASFSIYRVSKR